MFRKADLVLITKIDLLPHLPDVRVATIADALGLASCPGHAIFPCQPERERGWSAGLIGWKACGCGMWGFHAAPCPRGTALEMPKCAHTIGCKRS